MPIMAIIIHKVLFERLGKHPEWEKFRETFEVVTGSGVELVDGKVAVGSRISAAIDVRGVHVGTLEVRLDRGAAEPSREMRQAWRHLLSMASERFASILAESHIHDHERLPTKILQTCRWIRSRALTDEVRLGEAAEACGLSASHLSRLFHRSTGMAFQDYVTRFRLERACELLTSSTEPVTAIAFEAGFQSISQFHRSFKAVYGERPLDYRKKRVKSAL